MSRRVAVLAAGIALALAACGSGITSMAPAATAIVTIESGVEPRMTLDQVSAVALGQIHRMELAVGRVVEPARIISLTATTAAGVEKLEPASGHGVPRPAGIQWLVRARGTFTNERVPPGGQPMVARSGYFIIGDADGSLIGFGFP